MATAAKASQGIDFGSDAESDSGGLDTGTLLGVVGGVGLIVIAVIRGGDSDIFVNLNAVLSSWAEWSQRASLLSNPVKFLKWFQWLLTHSGPMS